jgi:hypothetical protein
LAGKVEYEIFMLMPNAIFSHYGPSLSFKSKDKANGDRLPIERPRLSAPSDLSLLERGATTLCITTFSITTLSITTFSIMTFSITIN